MERTWEPPSHQLTGISFGLLSCDEIRRLSVKEMTNKQTFDALLHPTYGGLYDPALGATERDDVCDTCGMNSISCPGHMAHIELPVPVYNPVLFKTLFQILRGSCFSCHHLMLSHNSLTQFSHQIQLLDYGLIDKLDGVQGIVSEVTLDNEGVEQIHDLLLQRLKKYIKKATKGIDKEAAFRMSNTKNIVEIRQQLVKTFFALLCKAKKSCLHCKAPVRPLRSEYNAKIFFSKGLSHRQARALLENKRKKQLSQRLARQNEEAGDVETDAVVMETETAEDQDAALSALMDEQVYLTPLDARSHLRHVWDVAGLILGCIMGALSKKMHMGQHPSDIFFMEVVPVPPSRFRPISRMGEKRFENSQTAALGRVLGTKDSLLDLLQVMKSHDKTATDIENTENDAKKPDVIKNMDKFWQQLQVNVNCVYDGDMDKISTEKLPGIKQLLEKKEGLFRKHMMGKRVNFAARSVISPDPYISTNEIGLPLVFALKLTYPEPVTPWNFQELKQAVINGPLVHPGACFVEKEDGKIMKLSETDRSQREGLAKQLLTPSPGTRVVQPNQKVLRHVRNGDVMLLNRQPTLHRPSIQAHKVRVLQTAKTLRLHYSNCKAYNADFDGDEMNAHLPQDEISRAEALELVCTDWQYLVPKDGTPLGGLIQDSIVAAVLLTARGRHFCRADYYQLVYTALTDKPGRVLHLPPCILKPHKLWSGKQVLSTVLLNLIPKGKTPLSLVGKAKTNPKTWSSRRAAPWIAGGTPLGPMDMSESEVVIVKGELLVGVLDKGHYGPTPYGLVHSCYELYGGAMAGKFLTALAKLSTTFLQYHGFTLGVEDIICTAKADSKRVKLMRRGRRVGPSAACLALGLPEGSDEMLDRLRRAHFSKDEGERKDLDLQMKGKTDEIQNEIVKVCMPLGLEKMFPHNNLQLMVQAGAKGSTVNCLQISCLLGQIELEGRRPPLMMSGQSLPSFSVYETAPRSRGFIDGRFLTGIRPQEYFFHCMAGREGLIDTAVKTSRSGYLQRCIIKHLEGLVVNYDMTVRDSDTSVVQFHYGEDSMDICKTPFLCSSQLPFLIQNQDVIIDEKQIKTINPKILNFKDTNVSYRLEQHKKEVRKWQNKHAGPKQPGYRISGFLTFCQKKWESVIESYPSTTTNSKGRTAATEKLCEMWREVEEKKKKKYEKSSRTQGPAPTITLFNVCNTLGAVSERFDSFIDNYISSNPDKLVQDVFENRESCHKITSSQLRNLMYYRHLQALAPPGEAVGLLASQSIGEPSTQMTLNTFHFAGRGEMNVTLGIPRLREILMVASQNIKTPTMDILIKDSEAALRQSRLLQQKLTRVTLNQVLQHVEVIESLRIKNHGDKCWLYKMHFKFLPHNVYKKEFYLSPEKIMAYMETRFLKQFQDLIRRKLGLTSKQRLLTTGQSVAGHSRPKATAAADDEEDLVDDDFNDGDATAEKTRQRQMEDRDYEGEEEEKMEVIEQEPDLEEPDDTLLGLDESEEEGDSLDTTVPTRNLSSASLRKQKHKLFMQRPMDPKRVSNVKNVAPMVVDYKYDTEQELWCEATYQLELASTKLDLCCLLEEEARRAVVTCTRGISRCFLSEDTTPGQEGRMRLKTEGVNLQDMYNYDKVLDLNTLYTNDIHAISKTYGIEAANRAIIKEIRDVFAAYGITVDYRHLSLVADYMTFEGVYKAFNRIGLESNASPLQKMSFETTMQFLKTATIQGASDDLKSPSARLITGRLVNGGTGCFQLIQPLAQHA